jgi:hypothetical protein
MEPQVAQQGVPNAVAEVLVVQRLAFAVAEDALGHPFVDSSGFRLMP